MYKRVKSAFFKMWLSNSAAISIGAAAAQLLKQINVSGLQQEEQSLFELVTSLIEI